MKKVLLYFLLFVNVFLFTKVDAQVAAPELRCVSVTSPTSTTLSWVIPPDPAGLFTEYQIFTSATGATYSYVGSVTNYNQSSFVHFTGNTSVQSIYYQVVTLSSAGTATSSPSVCNA